MAENISTASPQSQRGRRPWGRKRSSGQNHHHTIGSEDASINGNRRGIEAAVSSSTYVPPSVPDSDSLPADSPRATSDEQYFVTQPPRRNQRLTGSISTLFRRAASKEPHKRSRSVGAEGDRKRDGEEDPSDAAAAAAAAGASAAAGGAGGNGGIVVTGSTDNQSVSAAGSGGVGTRRVGEDDISVRQMESCGTSVMSGRSRGSHAPHRQRIFYSPNDDSDDSFETRSAAREMEHEVWGVGNSKSRSRSARSAISLSVSREEEEESVGHRGAGSDELPQPLLRFRGFSTSISSLFLDESLVCMSMGCFGLILSNRTEYLLQIRDQSRGIRLSSMSSDRRSPTKIFSFVLLFILFMMLLTFVIWGFGGDGFFIQKGDLYHNHMNEFVEFYDDAHYAAQAEGGRASVQYEYGADDAYWSQFNNNRNYNNDDDDDGDDNDNGNNNNDDNNYGNNNNGNDDDDGNNNDDGYYDDNNGNQDDYQYQDDYYQYDDQGGRRIQQKTWESNNASPYHATGIFKVRDFQKGFWSPVLAFVKEEWDRQPKQKTINNDGRILDEQNDDAYDTQDQDDWYDWDEYVHEGSQHDLAAEIRISLFLTFILLLGFLGRRRRMRTRFQLIKARNQDDRVFYASTQVGRKRMPITSFEDSTYEGPCSHTLCGCYPSDPPPDSDDEEDLVDVSEQGISRIKRKPRYEDFVSRGFSCFMSACCGFLCRCWFQCLSVCALAQEAREMRLLIPPRYQRIDFITHQPFHEYQKDVNDLRRGWMGKKRKKSGIVPHYNALSRLSRYIVLTFGSVFLILLGTLLFNPRAAFDLPDAIIMIATFVQSFIILYVVHWIFHKSDLSLDAVIKFFAAGFVIAVPSAVFFETVLVNGILGMTWFMYLVCEFVGGNYFVQWFVDNYGYMWIVGELFNAYIIAAVTEELCKYYTFRAVEHPDLIFLTGLDRKSHDEASTVDGGLVAYPFGSHQVSELNRTSSFGSASSRSGRSTAFTSERSEQVIPTTNTVEEFFEDENDVRTYRQKAAAVTTGMISVAVGLACAENFMYVFLLGGSEGNVGDKGDVYEEWMVLLFRSIFPVHALAAAMQSVNMVRKFVECSEDNHHRVGVGRIILPAVIMHGTFDAILMGINVYVESSWDNYGGDPNGEPPYNPVLISLIAWVSITSVMIIGILWYYRQNRNQRCRLIILEEKEKLHQDGKEYSNPSGLSPQPSPSEVELV